MNDIIKRFDSHIEYLEELSDELAGAGDYINSDCVANVIHFLDEQKQLHTPKQIIIEDDTLRCPNCGKLIYFTWQRCVDCGQRLKH